MRWKALAEIYTMHSFAPFWNRIPTTRKTMGGKTTWSNPGKIGQEELRGSRDKLPRTTTGARVGNKSHVKSMRTEICWFVGLLIYEVPFV